MRSNDTAVVRELRQQRVLDIDARRTSAVHMADVVSDAVGRNSRRMNEGYTRLGTSASGGEARGATTSKDAARGRRLADKARYERSAETATIIESKLVICEMLKHICDLRLDRHVSTALGLFRTHAHEFFGQHEPEYRRRHSVMRMFAHSAA